MILRFFSLLFLLLIVWQASAQQQYHVVTTPYAVNLRNEKVDMSIPPNYKDSDPYQESQLLFQECVLILTNETTTTQQMMSSIKNANGANDDPDWVKILAPHQLTFDFYSDGKLHPYPGYVHRSQLTALPASQSCPTLFALQRVVVAENAVPLVDANTGKIIMSLSIGTILEVVAQGPPQWVTVRIMQANGQFTNARIEASRVNRVLSQNEIKQIPLSVKAAKLVLSGYKMMGWPYAWGGRSSFDAGMTNSLFTGVDCSGFVSMAYMVGLSIELPRNANDQFLIARNVTRNTTDDFAVGDLLFLGKVNSPYRMVHVMMYVGDGYLMESSGETRIMPVAQRMSVSKMSDLTYGMVIWDRGVQKRFYWGRILEEPVL